MTNYGKLGTLVLIVVMAAASMSAPRHKGRSRLATTEHLMDGMVHPNYLAIEDTLQEVRINAKTWKTLSVNAALLNEAGYLLVDDGRSLGDTWDNAAAQLREATAVMLKKVAARDKAGIASDLKAVAAACVNCHEAHR